LLGGGCANSHHRYDIKGAKYFDTSLNKNASKYKKIHFQSKKHKKYILNPSELDLIPCLRL